MSKHFNQHSLPKDLIINKSFLFGNYKATKKIGEGSFGKIYQCENAEGKYAMKLESRNRGHNLLESESMIMNYLKGPGIPLIKTFGKSSDFNILIMELLGSSFENIVSAKKKKVFQLKTVCNLAVQIITILEFIHNKHIIHQDIKPDNFVMGINEHVDDVYLIDFGLAKKYRSSQTLQQYTMTNNKKLTGTARYASVNALQGSSQSRRDDLEATGYVLLYLWKGCLPWQGLLVKDHEDRYYKIMEKKRDITPSELCSGFPSEFAEYITYTKTLRYEEEPDYNQCRNYFAQIMKNSGDVLDRNFEWNTYETNTNQQDSTATNKVTLVNNSASVNHKLISSAEDKSKPQSKFLDSKDNLITSIVNMCSNKNYSNIYNSQFNDVPSKHNNMIKNNRSFININKSWEIKVEKEKINCCCSGKRETDHDNCTIL